MSEEAGGEIRVLERFSLVDLATDHAERALDRLDGTLAIAACGGLVLTGTAIAGGEAPTTVTIKTPGGTSTAPSRARSPRSARTAASGSDITQANNNEYQWNIGQPGVNGKIYARARAIDGCQADKSPIVDA